MQDMLPTLDRRGFLGTGGALTLGLVLPAASRLEAATDPAPTQVNAWLTIGSDDRITLAIGSSDMGQGSFAGLAQVLCEDLMVDPARVKLVQGGPTLKTPAPVGTAINTVGSGVTRNNFWRLRDAGAIARETLVAAAMAQIGDASRSNYTVDNGVIRHGPSGATRRYGEVAAAAALLPPPASAALVPDAQFRCIGKTFARPDIPPKVDGSAVYGLDVRVPGMVYAVIRHCPSIGGRLAATPATPAGAIAVVPTQVKPGLGRGAEAVGNVNAVAVVSTSTWDAWQAARRLSVKWTLPADVAALNSAQFMADAQALMTGAKPYVAGAANPPGTLYTVERSTADAAAAITRAGKVVEATYALPYVAHACMEVLNCTVDYRAGERCEVWAPTQSARGALSLVVALTGLAPEQIVFHTTYLGGGLGRKAEQDFISQAVQVAMALQRPVKLMWPREEDFAHDQYRPMALVKARAGLDAGGAIAGWTYRNVSPSILAQRGAVLGATGDSQGYEGAHALPYSFGARLTEYVSHPSPVPVGFWRSVGASINTFAVESMIDELAAAAGQDPYQFRRARLTDPRWIAVLEAAAALGGWSTPPAAGRARGIAIGSAFNSIVAQVVEVGKSSSGQVRVLKCAVAIDCYLAVSPGSVEAQLVGGVVHGLNAALYGRQTFVNGSAQVKNFNASRMIRLNEMPEVRVTILPAPAQADRAVAIGGVGELGVPTLAPALANAWSRLTGQRVRTLPFYPTATMGD
ncbi:xanthine dehydrogenase family protein molybdopterin-binding subunit [Aquabacterium humicola]|uniref:xanthine dehydrogenase family protein molybdopterin-binding subunit n=1 Tax=Aquabacterium humicola TaxID=3237377 RepID=UPI00254357F4|nr:molybdopterin cofactor-binding domain-containing protein [Rubrivivax pictus]